ncbi:helicase HerA-like domain-containing protein [Hyphomonas sp. NPDC076900]|uniref:helicase HerA-like domain-containing protein n=1 Tax=unclassified Hyphomonas TaxID=2630699 RepID=UPI003D02EE43
MSETIFLGGADADGAGTPDDAQSLILKVANRHGLVAGATGTGKTVTLQVMAQAFADAGVPVFAADVKGDLSGIAFAGTETHKAHASFTSRAEAIAMGPLTYHPAPVIFWDVFGEKGHPIRATIAEMGPVLLSRLMGLTAVQEGILNIAFQYADDRCVDDPDFRILDLKDLRKLLAHLGEPGIREEVSRKYGNVAPASLAAVQRELLVLERAGAESFFGEPALELADFMRTTRDGRGYVNILDATKLINSPKLYSTFLLWLLSELFEELPEIGDPEKPRLVFFFDEAHLLFTDTAPALLQKIEQVVRLIRSKGVGVYFVTQNPRDVPESVLAQLGNRIQHALRAYTPMEQKAVKSAAASFRPNPAFKTETVITELGVGEALVSTLDAKGTPSVVQRTLIRPPASRLGPVTDAERAEINKASPLFGRYDKMVDRESAYEILTKKEAEAAKVAEKARLAAEKEKEAAAKAKTAAKAPAKGRTTTASRSRRMTPTERATNTAATTISREVTRYILRGIFGNMKKK